MAHLTLNTLGANRDFLSSPCRHFTTNTSISKRRRSPRRRRRKVTLRTSTNCWRWESARWTEMDKVNGVWLRAASLPLRNWVEWLCFTIVTHLSAEIFIFASPCPCQHNNTADCVVSRSADASRVCGVTYDSPQIELWCNGFQETILVAVFYEVCRCAEAWWDVKCLFLFFLCVFVCALVSRCG